MNFSSARFPVYSALLATLCFVMLSCPAQAQTAPGTAPAPPAALGLPTVPRFAGLHLLPTVDVSFPIGSILAFNKDGSNHVLRNISHDFQIPQTSTSVANDEVVSFVERISLNSLVRFSGGSGPVVSGNDPTPGIHLLTVAIDLDGPATEQAFRPDNLDAVFQSQVIVPHWDDTSSYFLVRGKLSATKITFHFDPQDVPAIHSAIDPIRSQNPGLKWDLPFQNSLTLSYQEPHWAALEVDRLYPLSTGLAGGPGGTGHRPISPGANDIYVDAWGMKPFPVPKWTDLMQIPPSAMPLGPKPTAGSAYDRLIQALESPTRGNFPAVQVFNFEDRGFAVVTPRETITEDGIPLTGAHRWEQNPHYDLSGGLQEIVQSVLNEAKIDMGTKVLNYRIFAFLFAKPPVLPEAVSGYVIDYLDGEPSWNPTLPSYWVNTPLPDGAVCTVLDYRFRKYPRQHAILLPHPGPVAKQDLINAGLWTATALNPFSAPPTAPAVIGKPGRKKPKS